MNSLKSQAIKSVKWTTVSTILIAASGPLLLLIQAKFLSPSDFAALAIVTFFIGLFKTFENFGISHAIIQRDIVTKEESSSLFFFNIILATSLAMVIFSISTLMSNIFDIPELSYLLKVTSLIVLLNGPALLFTAYLEKHLFFKELSIIKMIRQLVLIISVAILLVAGLEVLGVVIAHVISVAISGFIIIVVSMRKNVCKLMFYFNISKIASMLKFGGFVSGKQISTYLTHRIDELVIGYFFSREVLGAYHFAKHMLEQLRALITSSFAKVLYPLLSKLKNNKPKLTLAYKKISTYVALFSFPVFIGIAITAHLFVPLIFGEQWNDSVIFFQIFSVVLIFIVLTANIATSLLYSVGRPNVVFYVDVITGTLYVIFLVIFASQGIYAVLIVYSIYVICKTVTLQYYANNDLLCSFTEYLASFKTVLMVTSIMTIVVLIAQNLSSDILSVFAEFIISVVSGALVFILGVLLLEKRVLIDLRNLLFKRN